MSQVLDVPGHRHAAFAVKGGGVGAAVAIIFALIMKIFGYTNIAFFSYKVARFFWPMAYAYVMLGSNDPFFSWIFCQVLVFTVFVNFVIYSFIAALLWWGLNWHRLFLIVAAAPVIWYWGWLLMTGGFDQTIP